MATRGIPFHRYFKTVNRNVYESILDTVEHPTIENFHRVRINLKRIRFIHRLLKRYKVKGVSRLITPYTKLFKAAGIIRQLHLHAQLVSAYGKKAEQDRVLQYLHKKEFNAVKKWPMKASACLAKMIAGQNGFEKAFDKVVITVAAYSNDLKRRVTNRFTDELPEGKLHKSRKLLKEIVYSREISNGLNSRLAATYHIRTVLALEDAIGDWHDLDLLLLHGLPHQHRLTKKIRKELETKRGQEYEKIRHYIPHIIKQ
jgi:CHAD domain-containing protein